MKRILHRIVESMAVFNELHTPIRVSFQHYNKLDFVEYCDAICSFTDFKREKKNMKIRPLG